MATITDEKNISVLHQENAAETHVVGHAVNQEEHDLTKRQAFMQNKKTMAWCFWVIWVLILASFDNAAGSSILGIPQFRKDFGSAFEGNYVLPAKWQSAYSGAPAAFSVIYSLGAGWFADRIGRRYTLLSGFLLSFIGITLEVIATTNDLFFAGKSINGLAIGVLISVGMTYVGEIVPTALRGPATSACALAFSFGPFVVSLLVYGTGTWSNRWAYRASFVSQYGFNVTGLMFLPFMPESPWYLLMKGKDTAALNSLGRLGMSSEQAQKKLANIRLTLEEMKKETEGASYLESAPLTIQVQSGVIFLSTYFFYTLQLAGISAGQSFAINIGTQILSMAGNVFPWYLINKVGRQWLMISSLISIIILDSLFSGLITMKTTDAALRAGIAFGSIYVFCYNASIGGAAYTILTETATPRLRVKTIAIGLAFQNVWSTLWLFVLPYIFNPDQANLGPKTGFIFAGLAVLCLVFVWFYQPETRGRTYEEIDELFVKKVPAREFEGFVTEAETRGQVAKQVLDGKKAAMKH
ncbi:MFS general substrate transporter [Mollisia scopiformis]|uniref:MFS general substrate transporter n=1 Tax=Mollisia scopiformis TaxID=149040 RepID=A0A194WZX9_MOLSC|nr:MFS general substrate transporter [Mollisia scopiformis]KUJ13503.1 MFS general substrate transporter [Mollisia scopiformis]